jgi:GT2 family glycosyltransferase
VVNYIRNSTLFRVGIIVLSFNQFQSTTLLCLDSLLSEIPQVDQDFAVQVLVFDNGSTDGTVELLSTYLKLRSELNFFFNQENLGFARGVNAAARLLDCDWLLVVGSDAIFSPGSLNLLLKAIKGVSPKVAMLGPVTNESGNAQKLYFSHNNNSQFIETIKSKFQAPTLQLTPVYQLGFFCVLVRRLVWDELCGLDVIYERGYYEDFDFNMRAQKAGYKCLMVEDSFVYHYGSASFKKSKDLKQLMKNNKKIFLVRHPDAELRHVREDNLSVIQGYLSQPFSTNGVANWGLLSRIYWRFEGLDSDLPRSPLKKWLWIRKVNILKKQVQDWCKKNHSSI